MPTCRNCGYWGPSREYECPRCGTVLDRPLEHRAYQEQRVERSRKEKAARQASRKANERYWREKLRTVRSAVRRWGADAPRHSSDVMDVWRWVSAALQSDLDPAERRIVLMRRGVSSGGTMSMNDVVRLVGGLPAEVRARYRLSWLYVQRQWMRSQDEGAAPLDRVMKAIGPVLVERGLTRRR